MNKDQEISHLLSENAKLSTKIDKLLKEKESLEDRIRILGELNRKMFETWKETTERMHNYEDALRSMFNEQS